MNVSAAQFRRENLDAHVRKALRETGLAPSRLELEITEGVLIEDIARANKTMQSLKTLGILFALDDFGTGYSSLSYLEAFPLDRIKIDRCFVASLGQSERSLAIVRAVIGLAHGLGVPVLAEGIETDAQMSLLLHEGCDEMQGYLIGRPRRLAVNRDQARRDASGIVRHGTVRRQGLGSCARTAALAQAAASKQQTSGTNLESRRSMSRSHRTPFTTAPVADSQRSTDPLLFTTSARADSQRRWLPSRSISCPRHVKQGPPRHRRLMRRQPPIGSN